MENLFFIKIEIVIFFLSLFYVLYYTGERFYHIFFNIKTKLKPKSIHNNKTSLNKVVFNKSNKTNKNKDIKLKSPLRISEEDKEKIVNILKRVKVNSTKGYFDTAKGLIVEGLSIDKHNRELNLELALIYEKEKNYINAEYIYKDLLEILKIDFKIMKKLAYIYAMQNKLEESFKIYETIHNKKMSDDEVIELLSEISYNMKNYKKAIKYTNLYLVSKPRDVAKLFMKADSLFQVGKEKECLIVYERIVDLQPYNTKAKQIIEDIYNNKLNVK